MELRVATLTTPSGRVTVYAGPELSSNAEPSVERAHVQFAYDMFRRLERATKVDYREDVEEALQENSEGLLGHISEVDGALDELFESGSLTIEVSGKRYIVSLKVEEA